MKEEMLFQIQFVENIISIHFIFMVFQTILKHDFLKKHMSIPLKEEESFCV